MKILLLLSVLAVSCASHRSTPIKSSQNAQTSDIKKDLTVSVDEEDDIGDGNYRLYTFTFKNSSDKWKRIKSAKFEYTNQKLNEDSKIIIGADLGTWLKSVSREKEIQQFNKNLLLGSLAVFTTAAGIVSNSDALIGAGLGVYTGWVGVAFYDAKRDVEIQKHVPKEHILSPFSVPPGLTTQQWLAIEYHGKENTSPNGKNIELTVEFLDGETETFKL